MMPRLRKRVRSGNRPEAQTTHGVSDNHRAIDSLPSPGSHDLVRMRPGGDWRSFKGWRAKRLWSLAAEERMTGVQSSRRRCRNIRSRAIEAESDEIPAGVLALGFLICGSVAGFESTMRARAAADHRYAEAFDGSASSAWAADADCRGGRAGGSCEQIGDLINSSLNVQDARANRESLCLMSRGRMLRSLARAPRRRAVFAMRGDAPRCLRCATSRLLSAEPIRVDDGRCRSSTPC
jgi:hypothetical protein